MGTRVDLWPLGPVLATPAAYLGVAVVLPCLAVVCYGAVWYLVTAADEWPACPPRGRPHWSFWLL
jgi:hypothetical protein